MDSEQPKPVLLDIDSMKNNVILLLDAFFYVLIWQGETIVKWLEAGYDKDPLYANFKALLEMPQEDAQYILKDRFPMPRYHISKKGDTHERKIKVKVNPSSLTAQNETCESGDYFNEDVSLSVFMQHLVKLAV
jgi:protein transport protein SEC23